MADTEATVFGVNPYGVYHGRFINSTELAEIHSRHYETGDDPVVLRHQRDTDACFIENFPELGGTIRRPVQTGTLGIYSIDSRQVFPFEGTHHDAVPGWYAM